MDTHLVLGKRGSSKMIEVTVARDISHEQAIISRFEELLGNEYEIHVFINPKVIGGFYIRDIPANKEFDGTIRGQLEKLRQNIVKQK